MKYLVPFIVFGCFGITTEIFFTSFMDLFGNIKAGREINFYLEGKSYAWMFLIYGSAAFLFPPGYQLLKGFPLILRLLIYALVIFAVEFIAGWILDMVVGKCPWEYNSSLAICGYIRLDYLPFWMICGFIIERIYLFLLDHSLLEL